MTNKKLTSKQAAYFKKPRAMDEITIDLFKGDAWAANEFQNHFLNNNTLKIVLVENGGIKK